MSNSLLRNGFWLILRDTSNIVIRSGGSFFIMAIITPVVYGEFAFIIGIALFLTAIGQMGINTLILKSDNLTTTDYYCINSIIIFNAIFFSFLFVCLVYLGSLKYFNISLIVVPGIFLGIIKMPFLGNLEKLTKFKEIAQIDINSQVIFYIIVIPLCLFKPYVLSLLIGQLLTVGYSAIHTIALSKYDFKLKFNMASFKKIRSFCLNYIVTSICNQSRLLLNILLPQIINFDISGKIAIASRFYDTFNIFGDVSKRLTLSGLRGKEGNNKESFINRGLTYLTIFLGVFLCTLSTILPILIEKFLKNWIPVKDLLPLVFVGILISSVTPVLYSILYRHNKNMSVSYFSFLQNLIVLLGSIYIIPIVGLKGYTYSLLLSCTIPIILFLYVRSTILRLSYKPLLISLAYSLIILLSIVNPYFIILCIIPICSIKVPEIYQIVRTLRGR